MSKSGKSEDSGSFDRFARTYDQILGDAVAVSGESGEYFTKLKIEILREMVGPERNAPGLRFLDYGCGTGRASTHIARLFPGSQYVGLDPSAESIRWAREHHNASTASFGSLQDLDRYAPGSFSHAMSAVVLHHIPVAERSAAVARVHRALVPGGGFFIFEHNPLNPLTRLTVSRCPFDRDAKLLRAGDTRRLLRAAGFCPVQIRYYFFFPAFLHRLRFLERHLAWNALGAQYVAVGWKADRSG